jgi:hypothetical protein
MVKLFYTRTRPARSVSTPSQRPAADGSTPAVQITVRLGIRTPLTMTPCSSMLSRAVARGLPKLVRHAVVDDLRIAECAAELMTSIQAQRTILRELRTSFDQLRQSMRELTGKR